MEILAKTEDVRSHVSNFKTTVINEVGQISPYLVSLYNANYHSDYRSTIRSKVSSAMNDLSYIESYLSAQCDYVNDDLMAKFEDVVLRYQSMVRSEG